VLYVLVLGTLTAFVGREWLAVLEQGASTTPMLWLATLIVSSADVRLLTVLPNRTVVDIGPSSVRVTHGPFPHLGIRGASVGRQETRDFEVRVRGPHHEVVSVDADGSRASLVRPLVSAEQAEYVRDALRRAWGVPQGAVPSAPAEEAATKTGGKTAMPAWLPLLLIVGGVGVFFFTSRSEVDGSVRLGDGPMATAIAPDDCRSGVPRGFFGVELTSEGAPGTVVRVVRDPTRGALVAVERNGGVPEVFGPDACSTLDLRVEQTSTSINDVWVLRGSARAVCAGLEAHVTFDGCH